MSDSPEKERPFSSELAAWMRKQFGWEEGKKVPWKDDWTLIVALHAMIETGLNGALLKELEKPALEQVIAKLDTSNQATGKVAFAKALGILDRSSILFLQQLSDLRNRCVHDVRNFDFNLIEYLTKIGEEKRNAILKHVYRMAKDKPGCPQVGLLIGAMSIMAELMIHDQQCQSRNLKKELFRLKAERLDVLGQSIPTK